MNKFKLFIWAVLCLSLTACGDDNDDNGNATASANANANTLEKGAFVSRIEVPLLQKGSDYQLLVKRDPDIDINYMVEWDCKAKAQRWTCWHWTNANSFKGWERKNWENGEKFNDYGGNGDPFQPDPAIPTEYRSNLSDYKNSGYSRGHMCASEDRICSKNVNGQTFYLSNMHPQNSSHNSGIWSRMESKVRKWRDAVVANGGEMFVCRGGTIYAKGSAAAGKATQQDILGTIGTGKLPIPKYFFMATLVKTAAGRYTAMAFWSEHKEESNTDLTQFMITIDELERRTGYDFFCNLPDAVENVVESSLDTADWQ